MTFDREIFYIEENKLAEAFERSQKEFDELVDFLISSSEEKNYLREWIHFVVQGYINKQQAIRIFSREGAIAIANYIDLQGEATDTALHTVFALLDRYRLDRIDNNIRRSVYENSSSLTFKNQRHWLDRQDIVKIFKTTRSRLDEAFRNIQRSEYAMKITEDFDNREETDYFSLSGLEKLSVELSISLRSQERQEYCNRVREVAPPVIEFLAIAPSPSPQEIERTVRYVKNRDKFCQITEIARDKYENRLIKLVGHHLYDKNNYPFLANDPDNIVTITEQISDDFYQWNGGFTKTCTIDDFIEYVEWRYPQKHEVILMLHNRRRVLLLKLGQLQRTLPEGN
ncbi:MAG: hypothetical protein AAGA60_20565 [Cyanobacteria bacterium P01_E01_bin.42]